MDEPLLTPRQVDALLLVAEHGPAVRDSRTWAAERDDGETMPFIHGGMADRLVTSGHLMHFGSDDQARQRYALTPLGWHVAEVARPGVEVRRRRAAEAAPPVERCCEFHRDAGCCDVNDCGPCCPACPTCPTLERQRQAESEG